jgi:hypothetical protein
MDRSIVLSKKATAAQEKKTRRRKKKPSAKTEKSNVEKGEPQKHTNNRSLGKVNPIPNLGCCRLVGRVGTVDCRDNKPRRMDSSWCCHINQAQIQGFE